MSEINTVIIPLNEYMDLCEKAKMNSYLMAELGRMDARFQDIDSRLFDLARKVEEYHNGK